MRSLMISVFAAAAAMLAACGGPVETSVTGPVDACAADDSSGSCAIRRLVSQSLGAFVNGTAEATKVEQLFRMRSGEEQVAEVELEAGERYLFVGACDRECLDVDLYLRNSAGEQVTTEGGAPVQDVLADRVPVIGYTATETGVYQVAISMFQCLIEPCYAGVRVIQSILDPTAQPRNRAELTPNFSDPMTFAFEAGGERAWRAADNDCTGYFNEAPDLVLSAPPSDNPRPLVISAGPADRAALSDSEHDTTLMIFHDNVWQCDDDSGIGVNPAITIDSPSDEYAIWVGTYVQGARPQTQLMVSERISQ